MPLSFLINLSTETGIFPEGLKLARVTPIFKKGDHNDLSNYRPISILCSVSKIFELNIKKQLCNFFTKYNLLTTSQHGYTKGKGTETALSELQNTIVNALDNRKHVLGLFVDFSRAFECVDHKLLLTKLFKYGVRGLPLQLLESYLSNRKQIVQVNKTYSSAIEIEQGVPQGSVLGPFLFLIFANDLIIYLNSNPGVQATCYADDTNIVIIENDTTSLNMLAEKTYDQVITWSEKNNLILNKTKTNTMLFKNRSSHTQADIFYSFQLKSWTKILGITVDSDMTWTSHIDNLCSKLRRSCFGLRFLNNHCDVHVLLMVYHANFHSHLKYGILNWGRSSTVERVFILQKYAIRILAKLGFRDSCRDSFKKLNILTLPGVYILEACTYVHKNLSSYEALRAMHKYDTRAKNKLLAPKHRTMFFEKNLEYLGCKLYNALPDSVKDCRSIGSFKKSVKKILMEKTCYTVDEFLR